MLVLFERMKILNWCLNLVLWNTNYIIVGISFCVCFMTLHYCKNVSLDTCLQCILQDNQVWRGIKFVMNSLKKLYYNALVTLQFTIVYSLHQCFENRVFNWPGRVTGSTDSTIGSTGFLSKKENQTRPGFVNRVDPGHLKPGGSNRVSRINLFY